MALGYSLLLKLVIPLNSTWLSVFFSLLFIWFEHIYETDVFVSITNQCVFISFHKNGFSALLCSICYINASIIVLLESSKTGVVLHVFTGCFYLFWCFFSSIFCFRLFVLPQIFYGSLFYPQVYLTTAYLFVQNIIALESSTLNLWQRLVYTIWTIQETLKKGVSCFISDRKTFFSCGQFTLKNRFEGPKLLKGVIKVSCTKLRIRSHVSKMIQSNGQLLFFLFNFKFQVAFLQ